MRGSLLDSPCPRFTFAQDARVLGAAIASVAAVGFGRVVVESAHTFTSGWLRKCPGQTMKRNWAGTVLNMVIA
jgi:hypothetical protein